MSKFVTKRFLFSATGFATATVLLCVGKLSGECWVYAMAVCIAGHHAEDIVKAVRDGRGNTP